VDFTSLLGDEATSDMKISAYTLLDEGHEVKVFFVHKAILSVIFHCIITASTSHWTNDNQPYLNFTTRNEVFRTMFENKEMKEVKEGHVEISDISIKAMEWLLRYL